jgi:hypothetical protein
MELEIKSLLKRYYGTSEEFSEYWISNETDPVSEEYDKGIMDMTLFKYDKKDICKDMCYDKKKKMQVRVERFLFATQIKDWIIKCEAGIKRRSVMQDEVTLCERNRIWCFEDSRNLFSEWGDEIMLWGSRILYELCYAIMRVSKICM